MKTDLFELDAKLDKERTNKQKLLVNFTKFSSATALNKSISEDGTKYSNAYFSDGTFTTITISNLMELKKILSKVTKNEAIGIGVHKDKLKGEITTRSRSKELSRSKENFKWNDNFNLVMLDFDYFEGITKVASAVEYKTILETIEPALKNVQMLVSKSTSSLVVNNNTKHSLYENGGFHCYLIIKGSVERFKELLWRSCWAKGHGGIKFAADGSILSRTIFDASVLSPERLVFEALPTVEGNLSLLPRDIKVFNTGGTYLTVDEMQSNIGLGLRLETEAKDNAKETSLRLKNLYVQKHGEILADKSNISLEIAKKIIEAKTESSGVIYEDDLIFFKNGDKILARDITHEHNGMYILDPLEPDEANAVINVSPNGICIIHSFLHGGRTFEVIPADLDTKLIISEEAKVIAQSFLKEIWANLFSYGYSQKLYENWEIMFQAYIEASKSDFNTIYIISASAGAAKTTSLAHFIKTKTIETKGKFTSLVVVNTIQNGIEFKKFLTELLDRTDDKKILPRPQIMFAKDKEVIEDEEGNKVEYKSDVTHKECINAEILIITHSRLRKAVISGETEYLMAYKPTTELIQKNRDFFAVDEAIDFEEKALIKQSQSYLVIGVLQSLRTFYKNNEIKIKLSKLIKIVTMFTDFCERIEGSDFKTIVHEAKDVFGNDDISVCFDTEFIELICENATKTSISLESYLIDLSILVKSNFFHIDSGGEGIIISSNVDRIPSSKGFVILDASAVINHEYMHYINNQKAKRLRVHLDAKSYEAVTIHSSEENESVGKIDVPSYMIKPNSDKNKNIKVDKEKIAKVEKFKDMITKEILDKTTKDDKILIIVNKSFDSYLQNHLIVDRDFKIGHYGQLSGRNDLKDRNVIFVLTLPYKPSYVYYNKAYKHNKVDEMQEVYKFRVSLLLDEVYQAILRGNLRTNDEITKNAPKCNVYIRTSVSRRLNSDCKKIINTLEKMLIGAKVVRWRFAEQEEKKYTKLPDSVYEMRDILLEWGEKNPHDSVLNYKALSSMRSDIFDIHAVKLRRYKKIFLADNVSVIDWLEAQTKLRFLGALESKKHLEEQLGMTIAGRGVACFCRV